VKHKDSSASTVSSTQKEKSGSTGMTAINNRNKTLFDLLLELKLERETK
jgi:hypothetical protein